MCSFTLFLERKICNGNIFSTYYSKMNGILLALSKRVRHQNDFTLAHTANMYLSAPCSDTKHEFQSSTKKVACIIGKIQNWESDITRWNESLWRDDILQHFVNSSNLIKRIFGFGWLAVSWLHFISYKNVWKMFN